MSLLNKKIFKVERDRYNCVYEIEKDENAIRQRLIRYEMREGYKLFKIKSTYAKQVVPVDTYVIAETAKQAKEIFQTRIFYYSDIAEQPVEVDSETADVVLGSPVGYVII